MRLLVSLLPILALSMLAVACGDSSSKSDGYTLSGTITDSDGAPIEGVRIDISNADDEVTTDDEGKWRVPDLKGEVTVTPHHDNYGFSPKDRTLSHDANDVDFVGQGFFDLAGTVTDSDDNALDNVEIQLSFDGQTLTTLTGALGEWSVEDVFGDVTITPTFEGYAFTPESAEHNAAATDVDFVGELQACTRGNANDPDDPCIITYLEQLQRIQENLEGHYALGAHIPAADTANWNNGDGFKPIGDDDTPFVGTLDGRNYRIQDLTIDRPSEKNIGLFGVVGAIYPSDPSDEPDFGTVENVQLTSVDVMGERNVGGLVGLNQGIIRNVTITGNVEGVEVYVGGLVGQNYQSYAMPSIDNAHTDVNIEGKGSIGGLVGYHSSPGPIENSSSAGTVHGAQGYVGGLVGDTNSGDVYHSHSSADVKGAGLNVGGLIGQNSYNTVTHCSSTGSVNNTADYTGGLVGRNNSGVVHYSYSTGNVSGKQYVGGLAGDNYNSLADIQNSYAMGDVNGVETAGGLVGRTYQPIKNSFSTGRVDAPLETGGLIGEIADPDIEIINCYWDQFFANQNPGADGQPKSTADMYKKTTYNSWDFDEVWAIHEGQDYPTLIENPR